MALSLSIAKDVNKEESMKTWIGILVLDRLVAPNFEYVMSVS